MRVLLPGWPSTALVVKFSVLPAVRFKLANVTSSEETMPPPMASATLLAPSSTLRDPKVSLDAVPARPPVVNTPPRRLSGVVSPIRSVTSVWKPALLSSVRAA